ncbi:ABC transporter permease [Lichenibacterium dinghuense]|uniref:ABC transporter permease n=1 Tax=Lichenibacterium dinghuense TaxID=2895977 RepID=UPI001F020726|nr:ABC transporter permease subunit [Lichenibacterium sp. 6Y81]
MAVAAALVTAAALVPLGFVAAVAVETGWRRVLALVVRPRVGELLVDTVLLVGLVVPLSAALALLLAWLVERSDLPGARLWSWAAAAPLAIPAFVQGYAWASVAPGLDGLPAAVLVSVLSYFPFVFLPVAATLRRLDPALEESAAALGDPPARVFRRVVLPQLRLALLGGGLLVGLHLLGEYGLFVMIRFDTFTTAIVDQFASTFEGPAANMLAGVLALCCVLLLAVEGRLRGASRYARLGSGAARPLRRARLGRAAAPALIGFAAVALGALGVPLATLARWLAAGGAAVWRADGLLPALGETAVLALGGGLLTVLAALPMAWLSVRRPGRLTRLLESGNYLVGSLPGVVVALGLVTLAIRAVPVLYQTEATLLAAYAIMFLPRALVALRGSVAQAPVRLEEAAAGLGRSPLRALAATTLRLALPGAGAGLVLVGLGISNELAATQMLAPTGVRTLATGFWALSGELDYAGAAPYALLMILSSLPLVVMLHARTAAEP